jgi:lysophospholipid hydrolase
MDPISHCTTAPTSGNFHSFSQPQDSVDALSGYTLLNEVHAGGTVSSLFAILALFSSTLEDETEAVHAPSPAIPEEDVGPRNKSFNGVEDSPVRSSGVREPNSASNESPSIVFPHLISRDPTPMSSPVFGTRIGEPFSPQLLFNRTSAASSASDSSTARGAQLPAYFDAIPQKKPLLENGMAAKASQDSTLVVIPAEAFLKLNEKYPQAAAHIAQVILTRFQRVTCLALARYLGLANELLAIEQQVYEYSACGLPESFFRPGGLERLRRRFHMAHSVYRAKRMVPKPIPTPQPSALDLFADRPSRRSSATDMELSSGADLDKQKARVNTVAGTINVGKGPASATVNSVSSTTLNNTLNPVVNGGCKGTKIDVRTFDDVEEEEHLRNSAFTCMMNAIGLRDVASNPHDANSVDTKHEQAGAPVGKVHANRIRRTPNHPFASSPLGKDHSTMSPSSSANSMVSEVDVHDIDIRFYSKGEIIHHPDQLADGLFFVIDGLLAVFACTSHLDSKSKSPTSSYLTNDPVSGHRQQFFVRPGGVGGYMSAVTGHATYLGLEARTDVCVGFMAKHTLDRLIDRYPSVILTLARRLVSVLSPLVIHIDFALEWMQVNAGHVLYRQGDASDSIYLLLNGRLRTILEKTNGTFEIVSEYGQGESVGEQEVLMNSPRPLTTHSIRDTELARLPRTLFNALASRHPEITLSMARIIAARASNALSNLSVPFSSMKFSPLLPRNIADLGKNNVNLRTVAVLPLNSSVPVLEFAEKLKDAVTLIGADSILLNQAAVLRVLGKHAFSKMGKLKLMSWLAEQEERHRIVLYVADGGISAPWTQRCIRQADCILLIAIADQDPMVGEFERFMLGVKSTARKELVLLHPERTCPHGTTQSWLKNRMWIHGHHHVAMEIYPSTTIFGSPVGTEVLSERGGERSSTLQFRGRGHKGTASGDMGEGKSFLESVTTRVRNGSSLPWTGFSGNDWNPSSSNALSQLGRHLQKYYTRYSPLLKHGLHHAGGGPIGTTRVDGVGLRSDFARLARRLCGKSIGLVLGGGGARGIAHLGVIRALEDAGIPIDMVGGTSIGALVGGLYARDMDHVRVLGRLKAFSSRMTSVWRTLLDVTYPITSYLTGHQLYASFRHFTFKF